jgi:hypothetical protein
MKVIVEVECSQTGLKQLMDQLQNHKHVTAFRKLNKNPNQREVDVHEQAIIEAALFLVYCPLTGGYRDGPSIEDAAESLRDSVVSLTNIDPMEADKYFTDKRKDLNRAWANLEDMDEYLKLKGFHQYNIKGFG